MREHVVRFSKRVPVSVIVMTKNEEANIAKCLRGIRAFDEVFVVDSGSRDRTCAIAADLGATVVPFTWNGRYPKKKQWCLDELPFHHDWVLYVDADEEVPAALSREIAACLAVLHRAGIVHRDLKPSNVLYRSDDEYPSGERMLLGDLGIARTADAGPHSTIIAGSPYYMAPEQAEEETARDVDQRADIYSAAVILYELLTGRVPYPYATISEIRRAQDCAGADRAVS